MSFCWDLMIHTLCRTRQATAIATATEAAPAAANPTGMDLDIPVDPNEPTYCLCNQVSYGDMVACDNPNVCNFPFFSYLLNTLFTLLSDGNLCFPQCKIEWFHFGCVGLKDQPKGKWYCPDCSALRNRRKR